MKMSKFFSQAEEQKQSEITNSEKEYAHPEQEITDKVIGYFTSGNNIARRTTPGPSGSSVICRTRFSRLRRNICSE